MCLYFKQYLINVDIYR